jgi:transcriptional regulator with XRE-family HTH domain
MAHSSALVDALKRELKARGITYARVAKEVRMSEASIKRMFSQKNFTLARLDQICQVARLEVTDLLRQADRGEDLLSQLTYEQETHIAADTRLLLVAICALNHWTLAQILATYEISKAECIKLLAQLDRLGIIRLLPNNKIRPLVTRAFSWLPDGPIQRYFNSQVQENFFRSSFDRPGELLLLVNGMLSKASAASMISRLHHVAQEFRDLHNEDVRLPFGERSAMSLLVAVRRWELKAFHDLRRRRKNAPAPGAEGRRSP